jgi:hypothetical protein
MRLSVPVIWGVVRWLNAEGVTGRDDPNAKQLAPGKNKMARGDCASRRECGRSDRFELLGQRAGLHRLHAAGRAGKLDLFFAIRDFNFAQAHEFLAGRTDPNGR